MRFLISEVTLYTLHQTPEEVRAAIRTFVVGVNADPGPSPLNPQPYTWNGGSLVQTTPP